VTYQRKGPGDVTSVANLLDYLMGELEAIERELPAPDLGTINKAPTKPRDGMVRYADGVGWNPGSGEGFYGYYAGSWKKLG
jgi:hypothetical protein